LWPSKQHDHGPGWQGSQLSSVANTDVTGAHHVRSQGDHSSRMGTQVTKGLGRPGSQPERWGAAAAEEAINAIPRSVDRRGTWVVSLFPAMGRPAPGPPPRGAAHYRQEPGRVKAWHSHHRCRHKSHATSRAPAAAFAGLAEAHRGREKLLKVVDTLMIFTKPEKHCSGVANEGRTTFGDGLRATGAPGALLIFGRCCCWA